MYNNITPDFNFFVPIDDDTIEKAANKKGDAKYDNMVISGVASDASKDSQDETLEPNGYVLDRFLKFGYLNYDHRARENPIYIVGEPIDAKVVDNKFMVKGKLYKENPIARGIWDSMIMLKNSGSKRRMGFSIEGKAVERDSRNPKKITKALITGLAVTPNPVNTNSYAEIVKGEYSTPIQEYKYNSEANGGKVEYLLDKTDKKTGIRYTIDKNLKLRVEKAMGVQQVAALIPESLEGGKPKKLTPDTMRKSLLNLAKAVMNGLADKSIFDDAVKKVKK